MSVPPCARSRARRPQAAPAPLSRFLPLVSLFARVLVPVLASLPAAAQEMSSASFKIRTSAADMGGSDVPSLAEMGVSSAGFKSIYALGLNVADTAADTSASFLLKEGYIHTLNAPPRKLTDFTRLPEDTSFIFSNTLSVGFYNSADAALTVASDPDGAGSRIHFELQVATDAAFTAIVADLKSRASQAAWETAPGGPGNPFVSFPAAGLSGTATTDYAKATLNLADGNYFWRVRGGDDFFDDGPWSATFFFAVDPPQPILTSPPDGALLVTNTPNLQWNALAGIARYQVQVATDAAFTAVVLDTQVAATNLVTGALADNAYFWHVRAVDAVGNPIGPYSNFSRFRVSTVAPVITSPANGSILQDNTPTLTGAATADYTVQVLVDGAPAGAVAAPGGAWTFTTAALTGGAHTFTARMTDVLGGNGPLSAAVGVTIDANVAAVVVQPSSADVPGGSVVTLRAELRTAGGAVINPNGAGDITFALQSGTGTLNQASKQIVSDHIEITYTTAVGAETAVIRATETRSGSSFSATSTLRGVGSFAITAGPLDPGAKNAPAGTTGVSILQLQLASSGENVRVNSIAFTGSGTGNEPVHITQVTLAEDTNGSGELEPGTDRIIASGVRYGSDDGAVTFGGLSEVVAVGVAKTWLVAYDFDVSATVGATFGIALNPPTQVAATGVSSGNPISAGGALFGGGPVTITNAPTVGSLTLNAGANNPPDTNQLAASQKVELTQIRLSTNAVEDVRVTSLSVTALGTGVDTTDVGTMLLVRDVNGNGQYDAGTDTTIASAAGPAYPSDNGTRTFAGLSSVIPKGAAENWLVVYDLSGTGAAGATFQARLDAAAITAVGVTSGSAVAAGGLPSVTGGIVTLVAPGTAGSLSIFTGAQNPGAQTISSSALNVAVQQFVLAAGGVENVLVTTVRLTGSGSGNDFVDVAGVTLAEDVNGDGLFQSGLDAVLGTANQVYSGNDGTVTFAGLATTVPAGGYKNYLVVYNFSGAGAAGANYRSCLAANADVTASGATSAAAIVPQGAAVCGGVAAIGTAGAAGDLRVRLGANNPPASSQLNGATDLEMVQVELIASSFESVRVQAVAFTGAGTGNDVSHLIGAFLADDANGNGTYDPGVDRTIAPSAAFLADNGKVSFTGLSEVVPGGSSVKWLLVYNLNGTAPAGSTFRAGIAAAGDVSAAGVTSGLSITPFGLPVNGNTVTIVSSGSAGSLSIAIGASTPPAQFVAGNAPLVPVLQVTLAAASVESVGVTSITFHADGTGNDRADLTLASLLEDVNRNGLVDVGVDRVLGPVGVQYSADNGTATFAFGGSGEIIPGGQSRDWLLVYGFSGTAANGSTFRAQVNPATDVTSTGLASGTAIVPTGSQVTSATFTTGTVGSGGVRGSLAVSAGPLPPLAQEVASFAHGVAMLQFQVRVGSIENVVVQRVQFGSGGSGSETTDVQSALLVVDVNGDGAYEEGSDRVIAQVNSPFATDNGTLVFSGLGEQVDANGQAVWLLVFNFSGLGALGGDFQETLVPDQGIVALGVQSALPIIPTGTSQTGPLISLRAVAGSKGKSNGPGGGCFGGAAAGAFLPLAAAALLAALGARRRRSRP